jgi:hypothetical protein
MNIKNQVLKVTGNKIKSLVLGEDAIRFSNQVGLSPDISPKKGNKWLDFMNKTEIPLGHLKNITQISGSDVLKIRYQTVFGIPAAKQIAFENPKDQQAFYQFFQKEKGFTKKEEQLSCLKSTMNYSIPLVIILLLTAVAYTESMKMTSGEYMPPEYFSNNPPAFQFILERLGAGGVVCIGFSLAIYCIYKGWKSYFNPPVVTQLEIVNKK